MMRSVNAKALVAAALLAIGSGSAEADVASDRAAAILIVPYVVAAQIGPINLGTTATLTVDTLIQISNTSNEPVTLSCFYVNANGHCALTGDACFPEGGDFTAPCAIPQSLCLPGWTETDFRVILTPRQPIAWRASVGLPAEDFALDGVAFRGIGGASNAGSSIPPVTLERLDISNLPATPEASVFAGELKCVVVDDEGRGIDRNVIKGEATVVDQINLGVVESGTLQHIPFVAKYSAVGIQAIAGDANDDGVLELGGTADEYNGCANVLIVNHFFDEAQLVGPHNDRPQLSSLTLVPCTQDLRAQIPGSTTAQFLVFNEFEQRFSTSRPIDCWFNRRLSFIDTNDPNRSIFSAGVAGTVAGQTRVRGVTSGLIGVLHTDLALGEGITASVGFGEGLTNVHMQGERGAADRLTIP